MPTYVASNTGPVLSLILKNHFIFYQKWLFVIFPLDKSETSPDESESPHAEREATLVSKAISAETL